MDSMGGKAPPADGPTMMLLQAMEQERRRLADMLLGETAQILAGVLVGLAAAGASDEPAKIRAELGRLREIVRADLIRVQALASGLRPSVLDDFGLWPALRVASQWLRGPAGPQMEFALDGPPPALSDLQRTLVFRALEEAVRNAVRHAQARRVEISAAETPDGLCFRVQDDGTGFDAPAALAAARPTSGLRLMQIQVRALGGDLQIDSRAGAGARVVVMIPRGGADG